MGCFLMNEYINVNKSKFGEDMIKYYEMKNVLQMFDAYNKNDLKIKTIILTDDAILEMNNLIKEEKEIIEHEAVSKILSGILDGKEIENLFLEFDSHSTKEAMFAYMCDKLECDLQCKLYDEEGCVDLNKQNGNNTLNNKIVHELLALK